MSCPSTAFCAAVGDNGNFLASTDPASASPDWTSTNIDGPRALTDISCPSTGMCATVDSKGDILISTDPTAPSPTWNRMTLGQSGFGLEGISCPSTSLCVTTGGGRILITTNPTAPNPTWRSQKISTGKITCPSADLCVTSRPTSVFNSEILVSTNPTDLTPAWTTTATVPDFLAWTSCASELLCATVGREGGSVWFSRRSATGADWAVGGEMQYERASAAPFIPEAPAGISCPTVGFCVAVSDRGAALVLINQASASPETMQEYINGNVPSGLEGISCASVELCLAAGSQGQIFVGQGSGFPPPPANTSPPTISGVTAKDHMLTAAPGAWTNTPAAFNYQWQACDESGGNCSEIDSATGQSYELGAGDVGSTIRVQVTASNAMGTGTPATSAATAPVDESAGEEEGGEEGEEESGGSGGGADGSSGGGGSSSGNAAAPVPPSPGSIPKRGVAGLSGSASVIGGGAVLLRLQCPLGTTCAGVVKLIVELRRARVSKRLADEAVPSRRHKRKRRLVIGKRRYSIAGGQTAKVRIRLTRKGRRLLRRTRKSGLRVRLVGTGVRNKTVRLKKRGRKRGRARARKSAAP